MKWGPIFGKDFFFFNFIALVIDLIKTRSWFWFSDSFRLIHVISISLVSSLKCINPFDDML